MPIRTVLSPHSDLHVFPSICLQEMYKKLSDHDHQVEAAVGLAIATMIVVVTMFEDDGKDDAGSGTD